MIIRNTKEFLKKTKLQKILSIDVGKKRVGFAISDPKHIISSPLEVLERNKDFLSNLLSFIVEFEVGGILIGLPKKNDKEGNMCQMVRDIGKNIDNFLIKNNFDLPIFFWDESYTSLEAENLTKNLFKDKKSQKKHIDKFAAKIILDDFFNENLTSNEKKNL